MPTLLRLSKVERETLREAFRRIAWLEPSASAPNDPDMSEWAAFEDDVLFAMVPVIEGILEARTAGETGTPGTPDIGTTDASAAEETPMAGASAQDEPVSQQKPGDSFGDFLTDMAGPLVGDLAGIFVGGHFGTRPSARAPKAPSATDLLTGLIPTVVDTLTDLLDPAQGKPASKPASEPGQPWADVTDKP